MSFDVETIDQVRRIVRLEALRAAVLSVASESLEENVPTLAVTCDLRGDELIAEFQYIDLAGNVLAGGLL